MGDWADSRDPMRQVTIEATYLLTGELEAGQPHLHPRPQATPATQNVPFGASSVITEAGYRDVPNGGSRTSCS